MKLQSALLATSIGLIAALVGGTAAALPTDASGNLDLNSNGLPRLSPDTCYAASSVNATGQSNFPVAFKLFRDGAPVSADPSGTWFQANNGTFQFQPGMYELVAVNNTPSRKARVILSLVCH